MKIAISAESTIDVNKEILQEYDIKTVPFSVLLGEKLALDGEISPTEIFNYVDEYRVLPKTSAVNEFQFEEHFSNLLKDYDAVIHFSLSSALSSAYQNAVSAAKKLSKVFVIDSKTLSTGIALLAIYARQLADQGLKPIQIVDKCMKRSSKLQVSFVLNTTSYLYKGGRCSALQRFGSALLRIKPQILVNSEGKMSPGHKYFGRSASVVKSYCEDTLSEFNNPDKSIVFLTHSYATDEALENARNALKEAGFKKIYETIAGATITSHCGPKCLGILYMNDGDKPQ